MDPVRAAGASAGTDPVGADPACVDLVGAARAGVAHRRCVRSGSASERAANHDGRLAGLSGKGVIESASSWAAGWEHRRRVAHR